MDFELNSTFLRNNTIITFAYKAWRIEKEVSLVYGYK